MVERNVLGSNWMSFLDAATSLMPHLQSSDCAEELPRCKKNKCARRARIASIFRAKAGNLPDENDDFTLWRRSQTARYIGRVAMTRSTQTRSRRDCRHS